MASGKYKVPFRNGALLHYADVNYSGRSVEWRDNVPFDLAITLDHHSRGRSAAYYIWRADDGREFPMFMKEMIEVMQEVGVRKGGKVSARWKVIKRGQNYGLKLHLED